MIYMAISFSCRLCDYLQGTATGIEIKQSCHQLKEVQNCNKVVVNNIQLKEVQNCFQTECIIKIAAAFQHFQNCMYIAIGN